MIARVLDGTGSGPTLLPGAAPLAPALAMLLLLAAQVDDGRPFLFGMPTVADFTVAHCLWHLRRAGPVADVALAPHDD